MDVWVWPEADVRERLIDVSFRGNNRHQNEKALFPLLDPKRTSKPLAFVT